MDLTKIIEYFCVVRKEYIDWGGNGSTSIYEFTDNLIMFYYILIVMKQILFLIFSFCMLCGGVSCSSEDIPDWKCGPTNPIFIKYDCNEQTDTISVQTTKTLHVSKIMDLDNKKELIVSNNDGSTLQFEWIKVRCAQNRLVLSLSKNESGKQRRMRIQLNDSSDYYADICATQSGEK